METPNPIDPAVLQRQQDHLSLIPDVSWQDLFRLSQAIDLSGVAPPYGWNSTLSDVHEKLYNMGLIFNFPWHDWQEGRMMYNDPKTHFELLTPLEASMMLTAICRTDRFCEGELLQAFLDGRVQALVKCFRVLAEENKD